MSAPVSTSLTGGGRASADSALSARRHRRLLLIAGVVSILLSPAVIAATEAFWPRWFAVCLLAWWVPGFLLLAHIRPPRLDPVGASVWAMGLGWGWLVLGALLFHAWPGAVALWPMLALYALGDLALLAGLLWRPPLVVEPITGRELALVILLLIAAAGLWLPQLGGSEFFHDETSVLVRAREAIRGLDDALARHTKGPGEIAAALVVFRTLGAMNEVVGRLPFALMGVASLAAVAALARRLFGGRSVAVWAGVLLATNGLALALSRMVQYQGAILLLLVLAVWAAWEAAETPESDAKERWFLLAGLTAALGLLMHYEFILSVPVLLALAWRGWPPPGERARLVRRLLLPLAGAAALVVFVYWTLFRHPNFEESTRAYYAARFGASGASNLAFFLDIAALYSSIYYLAGLLLLVVAGLWIGWRHHRSSTAVLVLWFAPYLLVYLFGVRSPGTHFYTVMPAWSILGALPLARLTAWAVTDRRPLAWAGLAATLVWLAVSVIYLRLALFPRAPLYLLNFAEERIPFFWTPYEAGFAQTPRVGLPIDVGWRALGTLREWGFLMGTYASNEQRTRWYLGDFDRAAEDEVPDYLFVAAAVQDRNERFDVTWADDYAPIGEVRVAGRPTISLFGRQPLAVPYAIYDAEPFDDVFDHTVPVLADFVQPPPQITGAAIGSDVLVDVTAPQHTVSAGDVVHLRLTWRLRQPLTRDYKLFAHVGSGPGGEPLAQWDGYPRLNTARTSAWPVAAPISDHVLVALPADLPAGNHPLTVGLYDEASGERLGAVSAGTIQVR